jgi:hypothetical protein
LLSAAVEFTALLLACAPLLLALADVSPAREEPACVPLCCAEPAAEELFAACTPVPRLALADVPLDAAAPACVSAGACDCAMATPEVKSTARIKNLARFIESSL